MSAPARTEPTRRTLRVGGTTYPVLLPKIRDPRLHLAAVIVSLQVLGQVAFEFRLSIAQILISLLTCAVLEVGIAMRRQHVILWPASALLTGNGVAFILRVPGTEHGDWWSTRGWWIFAGAAAISLLSKHLIQVKGHHVFNPSNFGLVLCFLLLGPELADPLEFWWGPLSGWLVLALAIILTGGFAILRRLRLLEIAVTFWVTFVACLAVLAWSGHEMTARWHLGPVVDWHFWRVLAFSPEILVFLFFMITDPKTIPRTGAGRRVYAVAIGLLAALLVAPQTTEFGSKVAVLGALAIVCAARPVLEALGARARRGLPSGRTVGATAAAGAVAFAALLVVAGIPARSDAGVALPPAGAEGDPVAVTIADADGIAPIDRPTAQRIARDVVADLRIEAEALRLRDPAHAATAADGTRLADLWQRIRAAAGAEIVVEHHRVERVGVTLEPSEGQEPPLVVARLVGTVESATYTGTPPVEQRRGAPKRFAHAFELSLTNGRYLIVGTRGAAAAPVSAPVRRSTDFGGVRLRDVAARVGLDFKHGAFRFGMSADPAAMMGGGLCWLDVDDDGRLDLFAVNTYSEADYHLWLERGGAPPGGLFRNTGGRFIDVTRGSGTDVALRGSGCVAADFDLDGHTDLYVTSAGYNVATDGNDALFWGHGDGTFTEGARAAGIDDPGWHTGAAVGDVDGDGLPDLFVAGYADLNAPIPASAAGFPSNHLGVRDRLYLNQGRGPNGHVTFREVGKQAGIETGPLEHGLGAIFTDADRDGRLDLYVANDLDPNRLYLNRASQGGLGFRFEERARREGVDDSNAGMGIAAADYTRDGREDLFVTNSRRQLHAAYRTAGASFADARAGFAGALGTSYTGWGASWSDLDLDGNLDLVLANGAIPLLDLRQDSQRLQVLENLNGEGAAGEFADAGAVAGLPAGLRTNARGLAAADYDNDGDLDLAVNSIGGRLLLLENSGARGHWLEVRLRRFAPGARVTAVLPSGKRLTRTLRAGGSYLSSEDPRAHFGLGAATRVREVLVRLPDGRVLRRANVAADRILTLTP